jgi:hypothetical protein
VTRVHAPRQVAYNKVVFQVYAEMLALRIALFQQVIDRFAMIWCIYNTL